jgi:hypothetical protein
MNSRTLKLAALLLLPACVSAAGQEETLAVLASGSGVYQDTFAAFRTAYGRDVRLQDISAGKPKPGPETRTVVAFGGKAAIGDYPPGLNIVYCLSPGIFLKNPARQGQTIKIAMLPAFDEVFYRLKLIQPGLKRLKAFWMVPDFIGYRDRFIAEGAAFGIEVSAVKVATAEALPELLRKNLAEMDAFWVPPDPLLLTPENILILKEFSWGNDIPFYASNRGITREGATASVGVSFNAIGIAAAKAAAGLAAGEKLPTILFPDSVELTLNAAAAKNCGLTFPKEILNDAEQIFP